MLARSPQPSATHPAFQACRFNVGEFVWSRRHGYRGVVTAREASPPSYRVRFKTMFDGPQEMWVDEGNLIDDASGQAAEARLMAGYQQWSEALAAPKSEAA